MAALAARHPAPFPVAMSWLEAGASSRPRDVPGLAPPDGGVTLVLLVPDAARDLSKIETSLSQAERARLERIQHPRALAEFLAGRRLIREVLGGVLGVAPGAVTLTESERGALALDPAHRSSLRFNLSHTEGLVVLAVAETEVGVDVEWLERRGRTVELADRYFAPSEVAALRELPSGAQRDRFFDLWTLKESYIKARGLGLAIPLATFAFSGFEGASGGLRVTVDPGQADRPDACWSFGVWENDRHRVALCRGAPLHPIPRKG